MNPYIKLIRPINCIFTVIAVIVGALASQLNIFGYTTKLFIVTSSSFLIVAGGFILNNYCDYKLDSKSESGRQKNPIADGKIPLNRARLLVFLFYALGILTSILSYNWVTISIAGSSAFLLWLYSKYLKPHYTRIGNFVLSYSTGITYFYGLSIFDVWSSTVLVGVFFMFAMSIFASMGREIIKSIHDIVEDEKEPIRTFAVTWGMKKASIGGLVFLLSAVVVSPMPFILGIFSITYLGLIFLVGSISIISGLMLVRDPNPQKAKKVKEYILYAMGIAILAFGIGVLTEPLPFLGTLAIAPFLIAPAPIISLLVGLSLQAGSVE